MRMMANLNPNKMQSVLELGVKKLILSNFRDSRYFSYISDLRQYKPREDESVYNQKIGKIPESVDVYFKGHYLTTITADNKPDEALAKIEFSLLQYLK